MSIWDFREIKNLLPANASLLTLDEGNTSVVQAKINDTDLFFKLENKNPTGSWKDRGTAYKLTKLKALGVKEAVLASSGNAAISYSKYSTLYPELKLHFVLSSDVNQEKRKILEESIANTQHQIHVVDNPRRFTSELSAQNNAINLRSSIDNEITEGYWSLGFEIAQYFPDEIESSKMAVFSSVSSGTAFVGLTQGLLLKRGDEFRMPKLFACQTTQVHPLVEDINVPKEKSLADAIYDTICLRKPQILKSVRSTNGEVVLCNNNDLEEAKKFLGELKLDLELSYTSLLTLAAFIKTKDRINLKRVVLICSGR